MPNTRRANRKSGLKTRRYRGGQFNQTVPQQPIVQNWGATQVNGTQQKTGDRGSAVFFGILMLPVVAGFIYAIARK